MQGNVLELPGPFGIAVEVRNNFAFLALIICVLALFQGAGPLTVIGLIGVLLVSIFLHELGHAWAAHVQGVKVTRIILTGAGGQTKIANTSASKKEFITLMGPLVSLGLWAVLGLMMRGVYQLALADPAWVPLGMVLVPWLGFASLINLFLFAFNMVPVQPLDGGRLLLLGLRHWMPAPKAARVAGGIGIVFCVLWFPAMVWVFYQSGLLMLFLPSFALHLAMARGERRR